MAPGRQGLQHHFPLHPSARGCRTAAPHLCPAAPARAPCPLRDRCLVAHGRAASRSAPLDFCRRPRTAASRTGRRTAASRAPATAAPRSVASDGGAPDLPPLCPLRELRRHPSFHLLFEHPPPS